MTAEEKKEARKMGGTMVFVFLFLLWSYEVITSYAAPETWKYFAGLSCLAVVLFTQGILTLSAEERKKALSIMKTADAVMFIRLVVILWPDNLNAIWLYLIRICGVKGL